MDEFNQKAVTPIDEWIQYLKTGEIAERPKAKGLHEASRLLKMDQMSPEDRARYIRHMDNLRIQWDVLTTARDEGLDEGREKGMEEGLKEGIKEGIKEGRKEGVLQTAKNLKALNVPIEIISQSTGLSTEEIKKL